MHPAPIRRRVYKTDRHASPSRSGPSRLSYKNLTYDLGNLTAGKDRIPARNIRFAALQEHWALAGESRRMWVLTCSGLRRGDLTVPPLNTFLPTTTACRFFCRFVVKQHQCFFVHLPRYSGCQGHPIHARQ